jgi:tetratricopeptide (TPR) repeat protein
MPLFDGLTLGELVLLFAGAAFFIALLVLFVIKASKNQSYKGLLPFFAIPIVMMGFPTITSIKINKDGVDLENQVQALQNNPDDEASRKALEAQVSFLQGRTFKNPATNTNIARAEYALGQDARAKQNLQKALQADPKQQDALQLKQRMEVASKLSELAAKAQAQPTNPEIRNQLQQATTQASQFRFANPKALQSIQTANKILQSQPAEAQKK